MYRIATSSVLCLTALVPAGARAQSPDGEQSSSPATESTTAVQAAPTQEPGNVSRIYRIKVKPGMEGQWVEAATEHVAWHRQQNDSWTWIAFYVETGENTGQYGWISSHHRWSDFDEYDATIGPADGENAATTMGPYEESYVSAFAQALPEVSNPAPQDATFPLYEITHYTVSFARAADFLDAITRGHAALQQAKFDGHYEWSVEVNGGEGLQYTLVRPLSSWSEMAPERSIDQIFAEVLGPQRAGTLMQNFAESVISVRSWIGRILPQLSYIPEAR